MNDAATPAAAEQSLLHGRVRHLRLPLFRQPTGPDAPTVKRLLLPQGELAQFYDGDEPIRYLAFLELREGGVRGNHFHRRKKEFIYVIQGELDLIVEDAEAGSDTRVTLRLRDGELAVIEPGIVHALVTVLPGQAVEFSPARYDPSDTHRRPLA